MTTETLTKKVLALALTIAALAAGQNAAAQVGTFTVTNTSGSTFTVTRTSNTDATEKVMYRTVSLSAIAGTHFTAASGTLTFDAEHNTRTVTVEEKTPTADAYKYQTAASRQYRFEVTDLGGTVLASKDRSITSGLTQFSGAKVSSSITNLVTFSGSNFSSGLSSGKYLDVSYTPPTSQVETSGTLSGYVLIDDSYDYAQKPATVKNVTLAGSTIIGRDEVGGIVGYSFVGTFENCRVLSDVTIKADASGADYHGGIVGYIFGRGTVNGCYSAATVTRDDNSNCKHYGGIVGKTNGTISNCIAVGAWVIGSEESSSGAIVGTNDGGTLARNYYYDCSVKSFANNVGTGSGDVSENDGAVKADAVLNESETVPTDLSGTVALRREFTAGKASTICLPFAMTTISGGKVYEFAGVTYDATDGWVATMSDATPGGNNMTTTEANKPYLFLPDATGAVIFGGTAAATITAGETTSGDWTFLGTYSEVKWDEAPTGIYGFSAQNVNGQGISQGEFVKVGAKVKIRPLRAYLQNENFAAARAMTRGSGELPNRIIVRLVGSNGNTTGIGTLDTRTGEVEIESWYDLNGRKLSGKPTQRAIYINNGKKIAIK